MQTTPSVPVFLSGFAFFLGLYLVVFVIAKQLVLSLASVTLDNAVDVNGLQVGMIPAEQTVMSRRRRVNGVISKNISSGRRRATLSPLKLL